MAPGTEGIDMETVTGIRAAAPADIGLLAGFAAAMAWETEHKRLDAATVERGVRAVLEQPQRGRYYLAERAGEAVGTAMITFEWSDWRAGDWWWLQSVYVRPQSRRSGVFAALYRHLLAAAAATPQVCGLRLYVEQENLAAQATYAALGMHDAGYRMLEQALPWVAEVVAREPGPEPAD
jgi:GNAT superfamily N-acetyltransferase